MPKQKPTSRRRSPSKRSREETKIAKALKPSKLKKPIKPSKAAKAKTAKKKAKAAKSAKAAADMSRRAKAAKSTIRSHKRAKSAKIAAEKSTVARKQKRRVAKSNCPSEPRTARRKVLRPSARRRGLPMASRHMRIGLLGGSFNPAHAAHMEISLTALKRLGLDQVWWIVTPGNPLKDPSNLPSVAKRVAAAKRVSEPPAHRPHRLRRRQRPGLYDRPADRAQAPVSRRQLHMADGRGQSRPVPSLAFLAEDLRSRTGLLPMFACSGGDGLFQGLWWLSCCG